MGKEEEQGHRTVADRQQFTEVVRKLITAPPKPKAEIPRKRAPKKRK